MFVHPKKLWLLAGMAFACSSGNGTDHSPLFQDGQVVEADSPPPPIAGGTLLITKTGHAVVSDPDNDVIFFVDLATNHIVVHPVEHGAEPGRAVEDAMGRVHVLLRRGGAVLTFVGPASNGLESAELAPAMFHRTMRRPVCAAPRGITYDKSIDELYVVCATGELVRLPAAGGELTRSVFIDRDLRDVAMSPFGTIYISRFRAAELLTVDHDGAEITRSGYPPISRQAKMVPGVARRMFFQNGFIFTLFQQATELELGSVKTPTAPTATATATEPSGGYGMPPVPKEKKEEEIPGAVVSVLGNAVPNEDVVLTLLPIPLAIDCAIRSNNDIAVVSPHAIARRSSDSGVWVHNTVAQEIVAVAYTPQSTLLVQTRSPSMLIELNATTFTQQKLVLLSNTLHEDTGHTIFHSVTKTGLACASCHPEGGDDGHVWNRSDFGIRRTQDLRGGILATAPFHWDGKMENMSTICREVFTKRMRGDALTDAQVHALGRWLDALPSAPKRTAALDPSSIARGEALFFGPAGCSNCHSGVSLTNNATADVGTGGEFQVPSLLGIGDRAPFMHSGCAPTLTDRFTNARCGGTHHTNEAAARGAGDLVSFLESL